MSQPRPNLHRSERTIATTSERCPRLIVPRVFAGASRFMKNHPSAVAWHLILIGRVSGNKLAFVPRSGKRTDGRTELEQQIARYLALE